MSFQSCSKYVLLGLNLLFFIISLPMLVLGIWLKIDRSNLHRVMNMIKTDGQVHSMSNVSIPLVDMLAILLIVVGVFTMVVGFCGCCGAWKENKILLYVYCLLVSIIIVLQISVVIIAAVKKNKIRNSIETKMSAFVKAQYKGISGSNHNFFTMVFGALMIKMQCCGVNGREDFDQFDSWKHSYNGVNLTNPIACCKFKPGFRLSATKSMDKGDLDNAMVDKKCLSEKNSDALNMAGCSKKVWGWIRDKIKIIIIVIVIIMALEAACLVLACCTIRKSYEKIH